MKHLGFTVTREKPMIELRGPHINLYIEEGPPLGPVFEVTVTNVDEATERLIAQGCTVVKDEPTFPPLPARSLRIDLQPGIEQWWSDKWLSGK